MFVMICSPGTDCLRTCKHLLCVCVCVECIRYYNQYFWCFTQLNSTLPMIIHKPLQFSISVCVCVCVTPNFTNGSVCSSPCSPSRSRADPAVAVPTGPPPISRQAAHDPLDWQRLRVLHPPPRGHRQAVGCPQEQAEDELRQVEPRTSILL